MRWIICRDNFLQVMNKIRRLVDDIVDFSAKYNFPPTCVH